MDDTTQRNTRKRYEGLKWIHHVQYLNPRRLTMTRSRAFRFHNRHRISSLGIRPWLCTVLHCSIVHVISRIHSYYDYNSNLINIFRATVQYTNFTTNYLHNVYIPYTMILHVSAMEDGQNVPPKHKGALYNKYKHCATSWWWNVCVYNSNLECTATEA
jgi:hypothetical protein